MINNLQILKEKGLLRFPTDDDWLGILIMKRKKDQVDKENHQSARLVREYFITSVEELEKKMEEIIVLCETHKARAYIEVNLNSFRRCSYTAMEMLAKRLSNNVHKNQYLFTSAAGQCKTNELWILDVDTKDWMSLVEVVDYIECCAPVGVDKVITAIPTHQGYHLITRKFDQKRFDEFNTGVQILKKSPTLLYYPNSLEDGKT